MATASPSSGETTPALMSPVAPTHSALDQTFDEGSHISNIESFVVSTVPLVPVLDPETAGRPGGVGGPEDVSGEHSSLSSRSFALSDLWSFFDEWSAYGVEVPLMLDDEEHEVFQYYVPFLSGIQIFKRTETNGEIEGTESSEKTKDDASVGNESDKNPVTPPLPSGMADATRAGENVPGRELVFQYFEQASPYSRPPLTDTTEKLTAENPILNELKSCDLHPASWISMAWYPIYRIPVGQTLRDLSACFLTYHALSTQTGGGDGEEKEVTDEANTESAEKSKKQKTTSPHLRGCPPAPDASDAGEACLSSRSNRLWASDPDGRERIPLRTFGLAYYKLRSELWRPAEVADWLKTMQGGARGWLRGQKVIHPDFEFFQTRG